MSGPVLWPKRPFRPALSPRRRYRSKSAARRNTLILLLAILVLLFIFHLHIFCRQALRDKYSPTHFKVSSYEDDAYRRSIAWDQAKRHPQSSLGGGSEALANKAQWKHLASGCEGDVFSYNGTAIKLYDAIRSPFRNCLPGTMGREKWPVEIPATLLLGNPGRVEGGAAPEGLDDFVSVVETFFVPDETGEKGSWHLITPFFKSGSLETLAKRLRTSGHGYTATELDQVYRPSLNRLLSALGRLHKEHNLCHDDVKPGNIFIGSDEAPGVDSSEAHSTHWLLADLGNARHPDHPYHSSFLWTPHNKQLPDCRANDALRLLKSYMTFLRTSVPDPTGFDAAFVSGTQPWSCMYWKAMDLLQRGGEGDATTSAVHRISRDAFGGGGGSEAYRCEFTRGSTLLAQRGGRYTGALSRVVSEELKITLGDKVARFFALTSIRGFPTVECA
ncbi:hypothetical protein jhhlp_002803 [Lomentospora prolificans]|uniref:Protein kinase domain-containing protein n=1 Tax=Lomentospora prolificans TaxID=41688 RepID=A0A2N3NF96_9PEZI|nr:hypothetical protein jhhlp_002803 [Lomentospora prolificans]